MSFFAGVRQFVGDVIEEMREMDERERVHVEPSKHEADGSEHVPSDATGRLRKPQSSVSDGVRNDRSDRSAASEMSLSLPRIATPSVSRSGSPSQESQPSPSERSERSLRSERSMTSAARVDTVVTVQASHASPVALDNAPIESAAIESTAKEPPVTTAEASNEAQLIAVKPSPPVAQSPVSPSSKDGEILRLQTELRAARQHCGDLEALQKAQQIQLQHAQKQADRWQQAAQRLQLLVQQQTPPAVDTSTTKEKEQKSDNTTATDAKAHDEADQRSELEDRVATLLEENEQLRRKLRQKRGQFGDELVDRRIVTQLLKTFLNPRFDDKQVVTLIGRVLAWTTEETQEIVQAIGEKEAGERRQGQSFVARLFFQEPHEAPVPADVNELVESFDEFLRKELDPDASTTTVGQESEPAQ
ncbi:MAG: hypothetical protein MHM6MM_000328 [Cercozoa sp. M6MM]